MRFLHPAGAWALLLAIPIIALHVLRPNRMRRVVSSIVLWKRQTFTLSATSPWQRLVPSRLLMLQLLGVALFALTLTSPVRLTHAPVARHTVFIIDVSGSMEARDGSPTRLATAKTRARALRDQLPDGGVATIVTAGPQPRLALTTESARAPFDSTLASLATASGPTDWPTAFALAQSVDTPATPTVYVLISDGAMSAVDQKAIPVGTSWVRVGRRAMNRSVSRISVEVRNGGLRAVAAVRSTGGPRATQRLRFVVDGRTVATQRVTVGSGATTEAVANIPAGDRVVAVLEGGDLLAGDDTAYAVGATRRELQVLVAGPDDVFLRRLLDALPGVNVERTTNPATPTAGFDLAVYNEVPVPARPTVPFIAIASPGAVPGAGVRTTAEVAQPAVTLVRSDLPLLSGIDLSAVGIATSQKLVLDAGTSAEPLVSSDATPLIVRGTANNQPFVYFGFALADTNLPLQVAFPLLGDRLVRELGGTATVQPELHVGDLLPVPARAATVIAPSGRRQALVAGSATPTADQPGFWVVREKDRPDRILAVNADPSESSIEPATTLPIAFAKAAEEVPFEAQRSLRSWLIGAILVLLFFEWREGRQTRGVSARQWRGAMVLRALAVSCLVLALIGVSLPRRGRSVAVLFAIDASDSVSPVAAAAANDWVRDAMAFAPKGGKAGVLVFGSDARIESLVAARPSAPALPFRAKIDSTGTNIAAALRLASAVLPRDTKRRVVVVSDGRSTDGDAIDAAARLRREGIAVDVWPVARQTGADAAIDSLEVPTKIRTGESFAVKVVVAATAPGPAVIEFRRGSGLIAQRRVVLQTGSNTIVFDGQPGGNPGVARFEATVRTDGDLVSANDRGFAAATIDGPPRVLVVEGTPGEGGRLVAALRSQQLVVDVVAPGQLPPLEQLSGYGATVLVDVDARTLAAEQVVSLDAASRSLGKGLVVIGGRNSYGLGGYRGTDLEALLPVESEVFDPKRKLSVAEVLAIDTSGSMAACHCNGDSASARSRGGVNKTDISRTAALRAIEALSPNDQVGVLVFDSRQRWAIPLQANPPRDLVTKQLRALSPDGSTSLDRPLLVAGDRLRAADAQLKHIVLFTDGFTSERELS